jgi:cytochrome c5
MELDNGFLSFSGLSGRNEYCAMQANRLTEAGGSPNNKTARPWVCGIFDVPADPPPPPRNDPPRILSRDPSGSLVLGEGVPIPLSLVIQDESPETVEFDVDTPGSGIVSVTSEGGGRFTISPDRIGSGSISITLRDDIGQTSEPEVIPVRVDRDEPNEQPTITGIGPTIIAEDESRDITLFINDESPISEIELTASTRDSAVATVTVIGVDRIRLEGVSVGPTTLDIEAEDPDGAIGTAMVPINVVAGQQPTLTIELGITSPQTLEVGRDPLSFLPDIQSNQLIFGADYEQFLTATTSPPNVVSAISPGNDGSILVEPLRAGTTTVTVTASDTLGAEASASFDVIVLGFNRPPTIASLPSVELTRGTVQEIELDIVDDGPIDEVSVTAQSQSPEVATIEVVGERTVRINAVAAGNAVLDIVATDRENASGNVSFAVSVVDRPPQENDAPSIARLSSIELTAGDSRNIELSVTDDGPQDEIVINARSLDPSVASVSLTGERTLRIDGVSEGEAVLEIVATDALDASDSVSVSVSVVGQPTENVAPSIASISPIEVTTGESRDIELNITDDGPQDEIDINVQSLDPAVATVNLIGERSLRIDGVSEGEAVLEIVASDTEDGSDSIRVAVKVAREQVLPGLTIQLGILDPQSLEVGETLSFEPTVESNQSEFDQGYEQSLTVVTNPAGIVSAVVTEDSISLEAQSVGTTTVTVMASDSLGAQTSATFQVSVSEPVVPNTPPVANDDRIVLTDNFGQLLNVISNDVDADGDNLSIVLVSDFSDLGAQLSVEGNMVRYQPQSPITRTDSFRYRVMDEQDAASALATVILVLSDVDGDGLTDSSDNCPSLSNPDQADADSDGTGDVCDPTPNGNEFPTVSTELGREISNSACLICHATGVSDAPISGDVDVWNALFDQVGLDGLVANSINGIGAMPAFGGQFTAAELADATLFLAGRRGDVVIQPVADSDLDGVEDTIDNCPGRSNPNQMDSNGNGIGDLCAPDADIDGDGLPFSIDDNDDNSNRLPGSTGADNNAFVLSANTIRLGPIAAFTMESNGFTEGGVVVTAEEFNSNALGALGMSPVDVGIPREASNPFDVVATNVSNQTRIVVAAGVLQLSGIPTLQIYSAANGVWREFERTGQDSVMGATSLLGNCPVPNSPNYSNELSNEHDCFSIVAADGGANDVDGVFNNEVGLILRVVAGLSDNETNSGQGTVSTSSGGGTFSISEVKWLATLLLLYFLYMLGRARVKRRGHQGCYY